MRVCPRCRSIYSSQIDRCSSDGERLVEELTYPLVGQTLDRYRFVEPIGEGAMGCVYRATHSVLPREYAIKVLFKDLASNQTLIERFRREAQAMSAISHPNIVTVADFVTAPNGMTFIVMELVHGRTLDLVIGHEAPFLPPRAARIARQIAAGLGEAHRMGFVHRDVKPSNIMLTDNAGQELVKILDFGVVGLGAVPMSTRLTAIGHIIGTPTYMAPEQVHDPGVGPGADLYALGVILFEMLAGEPPFSGPGRTEVFIKHISEPPPPLPPSDGLELLAAWLLEKSPERRPKNAEAVIHAIDRLGIFTEPKLETFARRGDSRPMSGLASDPRSARPPIMNAELALSPEESDTYEPDTDSAISQEAIQKALRDTDPERVVSASNGSAPVTSADAATVEHPSYEGTAPVDVFAPTRIRSPAAADEKFPSLLPISSSPSDWTWEPDVTYDPVGHVAVPSGARDDTVPVNVTSKEAPATDPSGHAPLVLESGDIPTGEETILPGDRRSDPTDPVLYEPELPVDRTDRQQVDDGPTQVDFSFERESAQHSPTTLSIPTPEEAPALEVLPSVSDPAVVAARPDTDKVDQLADADLEIGHADTLIREVSAPQLEATLLAHAPVSGRGPIESQVRSPKFAPVEVSVKELRRVDMKIAVGIALITGFALLLLLSLLLR